MFQKHNYLLVFKTDIYECFKNKESKDFNGKYLFTYNK